MRRYLKTKDFSVTSEEFELVHHDEFDILVTQPQPKELDKYYKSENYISHTDANKSFVDKLYQSVKRYSIRQKTKLIDQFALKGKSLLDVGAGTGDFLLAAKKSGWAIDGVEPNFDARKLAADKDIELIHSLDELPQKKYDVITLWHVLEHLPELEAKITIFERHLNDSGTLIIAVPNFKSFDARHYKSYWAAYDVPRHLWHFSRIGIQKLFANHGFKLKQTKPMLFDAFYVSLLSEKYQFGRQRLMSAFFVGLRSNINALRTKEHSSLIYIFKKAN